ncbi:tetratricopeptide repeat protein [Aliiroseovarius subalbicans]|uniref:tetratricopeptide repeat protein n=1 Tax=Aliiroseovarius subalbicans TaxID=2925840 RepID=UPI001F58CBB1|nr:tetratricopeptide repeat protein [Aliiroseovarius subalbicans]MCI2397959.1 tetratricopeptide repeat protein [Aliiroseovarius subalbicans]
MSRRTIKQIGRQSGWALAVAALAACTSPGLSGRGDNPYAPTGVKRGQDSVDGLIVGHRLMAAGEYELALKSYLRSASDHGMTVDVLSALGSANLMLGRLGQAEKILRRATEVDETFPAAWNNLGVVLMEQGQIGEAARVFRLAFALDSGQSAEIRENLRLALAKLENPGYVAEDNDNFALVRRGSGDYRLLPTP